MYTFSVVIHVRVHRVFFQDIYLAFQTLAYQYCVLVHDIFMTFHKIVSLCDCELKYQLLEHLVCILCILNILHLFSQ